MLTILSIVIGIVFTLLLMSILASTTHDIIGAMLSLRGKHLKETLQNMLGEHADDFFKHPFFRQLAYAAHSRNTISPYSLPDWINKDTFSAILIDVLNEDKQGDNLAEKISEVKDPQLKRLLEYMAREAGGAKGTVGDFKTNVEQWFEEVMERASVWFGRATKWRLFGIGLGLAMLLNVDTIQVYQNLSVSPETQKQVEILAEGFGKLDSLPTIQVSDDIVKSIENLKQFNATNLDVLRSPLGLGWQNTPEKTDFWWWVTKFIGFILTGVAVTFGAPFWFELLKKLLAMRGNASDAPSTEAKAENKKDNQQNNDKKTAKESKKEAVIGAAVVKPARSKSSKKDEDEEEVEEPPVEAKPKIRPKGGGVG